MEQHTKEPWEARPYQDPLWLVHVAGEEFKADLLKALEFIHGALARDWEGNLSGIFSQARDTARAAIAKHGEGS